MTSQSQQERYRVVILGGGIHGVGVLHDLVSRGWKDNLLIDKGTLGCGTSSRSTKLIHGGLRYLEHIRDFPLVAEGLKERQLLMNLASDLVKPLPLIFPVLNKGGVSRPMIKIGLSLYDFLAGSKRIERHRSIAESEVSQLAPTLDKSLFKHYYLFYDGQTDDLALVNRVAASARSHGGKIVENTKAEKITPDKDGYIITLNYGGELRTISTRYIVNAMGPWAHEILSASQIEPKYEGINNKGAHLMVQDIGLKSGVFLQSPEDGRIFFVLPWLGKTLIGTTETAFSSSPDSVITDQNDIQYLLDHTNRFFSKKLKEKDIEAKFSGLRWLAKDKTAGLSDTSRSYQISQHRHGHGIIFTIYGGKLTAYRALSETLGNMIISDFGDLQKSQTDKKQFWNKTSLNIESSVITRFRGM
ncbi:MAG: glycerol-3-phosphate dehydrogenase/oxidase [Proteobacteria bacterium]|nr:glycerol-3-phosphate dehydrogenase/oxidase [Pseudomonadota bacterium]